jgi:hypothetical protein
MKTVILVHGNLPRTRLPMASAIPINANRTTSKKTEIQMISMETLTSDMFHVDHRSSWNRKRLAPSTSPVRIPNQTESSKMRVGGTRSEDAFPAEG